MSEAPERLIGVLFASKASQSDEKAELFLKISEKNPIGYTPNMFRVSFII